MASSSWYENTSLSYTSIYLMMSKRCYSAEEVLQCLDEDSDSHFYNDDSETDENDSEIDVVSFNPVDNPSNLIQQVSPSSHPPSDGVQQNFHILDNVPSDAFRQPSPDVSTSTSSSTLPSSPILRLNPSSKTKKRKCNMSTSRSIERELADFSSSYDNIQSTSCETLLVPPSFTLDVNSSPSHQNEKTCCYIHSTFGQIIRRNFGSNPRCIQ